ncbi:MAG: potassium-transporting ATPase subunit KdpC [Bacteroidales bacterium]|nr:potassium-transporting ATPase subunit KdpC [Bacteroidales bacterium]
MKTIVISLRILLVMTILTGVAYPILITVIGQTIFHHKVNGSLVQKDGKVVGSELIGQIYDSTLYFWSRPSAIGYNPLPSSGSNLGPTSKKLKELVDIRRQEFTEVNKLQPEQQIPSEMLFASGSGLDPHISVQAALLQVNRIARVRNFNTSQKQTLLTLIAEKTESPQFSLLGEQRINVLMLNLDLDKIK